MHFVNLLWNNSIRKFILEISSNPQHEWKRVEDRCQTVIVKSQPKSAPLRQTKKKFFPELGRFLDYRLAHNNILTLVRK